MEIPVTKTSPLIPAVAAPAERHAVPATTTAPAEVAPAAPEPVPARKLVETREAISELVSRYLQSSARNLEFQVEGDSATPVIIVRDGDGNVVRRIPGEAALQMLRLANAQSGTFVNSVA